MSLVRLNNYCTFYIVRHGETDWNALHKIQGHTDIPLNKQGEIQAKNLARELQDVSFDKVYSSDLLRAHKTAEIITLEKQLAVEATQILRERRFGFLEGHSSDIFLEINKTIERLDHQARLAYKYDQDAESNRELLERCLPFLREVAIANPGKTILIVTHGGIIRALISHLTGVENPKRSISNTAYLKIETDGVDFFLKSTKGIQGL